MITVEMQTASLPTTFPAPGPYFEPTRKPTTYADVRDAASRTSSKENRTPPAQDHDRNALSASPQTIRSSPVSQREQARQSTSPQTVAGKKRSANGELKEPTTPVPEAGLTSTGRARTMSTLSDTSNRSMLEVRNSPSILRPPIDVKQLSQQLRTRLTYAMVKVQNGWQTRSLEEVESLASASPRSTVFNHYSNNSHLLSPRAAMTAHLSRQSSGSNDEALMPPPQYYPSAPTLMSPPSSKKGLAPPVNLISRPPQERRRPTPNAQSPNSERWPLSSRPAPSQRTPSQTARIEADAVETLLFMASPNHSGNPGQGLTHFSPMTTTSSPPLSHKSQVQPTFAIPAPPNRVPPGTTATNDLHHRIDKNAKLTSLLERLDHDGDAELERALQLMDAYHATKLTA